MYGGLRVKWSSRLYRTLWSAILRGLLVETHLPIGATVLFRSTMIPLIPLPVGNLVDNEILTFSCVLSSH